jgi:hypothetical protein
MGLSTETYKASEYDRLSLSLLCPLPNEHDFAINVCTLLSNEGKHTLRLEKCPRLVDFLLAHAGVYAHGECFMQQHNLNKTNAKSEISQYILLFLPFFFLYIHEFSIKNILNG